jgi:SAM-dependent methyltransferase
MRKLKADGTTMVGIDIHLPDEPHLILDDVRLVSSSGAFPIADEVVDVIFSDWVLEHVDDPQAFFNECARVLRPGGVMLARTLQRWGVASVGARVVPAGLHNRLIGLLQPGMTDQDVFPVRLACNTRTAVRNYCSQSGLLLTEITCHPGLAGYAADRRVAEVVIASVEWALPKFIKHAMVVTVTKASLAS